VRFVVTLRDGRPAGTETEALIDADPQASLLALMPDLLAALDDDTDPALSHRVPVWVDGVPVAPNRHTLRSAAVRPGSVVELHSTEERPALDPSGVAEVRVVNGPGAGRVHRLGLGQTVVGHEAPGLSLPDDELEADELTLTARPGGAVEVSSAGGTLAAIDGVEVHGRTVWPLDAYLVAGQTVLELAPVTEPDGDSRAQATGLGREVVRHPRSVPRRHAGHFVLPARPTPTRGGGQGREYRRQLGIWQQERVEARDEVLAALARETRERREATPDPAATLLTALGPGRRLWERLPLDDDWLQLRLGLADQPPRTVIEDLDGGGPIRTGGPLSRTGQPESLPTLLGDVPVTLNLQAISLLGIVGHPATSHAVARWLVAQCATYHSPRELRLTVLTARDYAARRRWEWVSRLPHARPDEASGVTVLIGNDRESVGDRLYELGELIAERTQPRRRGAQPVASSPEVVVVLDGVQRLSNADGVGILFESGHAAGVHVICIDGEPGDLPSRCRNILTCGRSQLAFRRADSPLQEGIRPDLVESAWADRLSRALAPLALAYPGQTPPAPADSAAPHAWPVPWDDVGYPAPAG
jgi:S-DNA-T family DNA segregation ATPase FtsK/SpoIIIE